MAQTPTRTLETTPESPIASPEVAAAAASVIAGELKIHPDNRQEILHAVNTELGSENVVARDTSEWKVRGGGDSPRMSRAEARAHIIAAHKTRGGLLQYSTAVEVAQLEARPRSNRAQ